MDHTRTGVWGELTERLGRTHVPRLRPGFGRVTCEPGWSWRPTLTDHDLWLVLSGRGWGEVAGVRTPLRAGTLFVLRPGDRCVFGQDAADRLSVAYCHFDFVDPRDGFPARLPDDLLPARTLRAAGGGRPDARLNGRLERLIRLRRDPHPLHRWEAEAALAGTLAEVYRLDARTAGHPAPDIDPRLQDALDFLAGHLDRRPLLAEVAAAAGLSPSALSRLFTTRLGTTVRAYQLELRLERAHELLTETAMTVTEIAAALGYPDLFLFSRQVKARYGSSPRALRPAAP